MALGSWNQTTLFFLDKFLITQHLDLKLFIEYVPVTQRTTQSNPFSCPPSACVIVIIPEGIRLQDSRVSVCPPPHLPPPHSHTQEGGGRAGKY